VTWELSLDIEIHSFISIFSVRTPDGSGGRNVIEKLFVPLLIERKPGLRVGLPVRRGSGFGKPRSAISKIASAEVRRLVGSAAADFACARTRDRAVLRAVARQICNDEANKRKVAAGYGS
jgi:hypothetical protein